METLRQRHASPEAPTATQRLAELDALRQQHGGYLIPPPADLGSARIMPPPAEALGGDGLARPNKAMQGVEAWFREIAAIGSPADLEFAWQLWRPPDDATNPKHRFEPVFLQLCAEAGRRFNVLWEQAEAERRQGLALLEHRDRAADLRRQIVDAEREVARLKTLLANHEVMRPAA
jgi:hypothetical protein